MDSCSDDVLHLILFEHLSSSPRGGLSTVMVQCRLVCKRWNETILGWPEYKEMKSRADEIGSFVDTLVNTEEGLASRKLSVAKPNYLIHYLAEKDEQRYPELAYGLLQHVKEICISPSAIEMKTIGLCESAVILRLEFNSGNINALKFNTLRFCKSLVCLDVLTRLRNESRREFLQSINRFTNEKEDLIDISPLLSLSNLQGVFLCPPIQAAIAGRQMWLLMKHIAGVRRADRTHPTEKVKRCTVSVFFERYQDVCVKPTGYF